MTDLVWTGSQTIQGGKIEKDKETGRAQSQAPPRVELKIRKTPMATDILAILMKVTAIRLQIVKNSRYWKNIYKICKLTMHIYPKN